MEEDLSALKASIGDVPWSQLAHAYDIASDAPTHLACFFEEKEGSAELGDAIDWMWASVLHQGSIYSASIPAVDLLIGLLSLRPGHHAAQSIIGFVDSLAAALESAEPSDYHSANAPTVVGTQPLFEAWVEASDATYEEDEERYFKAAFVRPALVSELLDRAVPIVQIACVSADEQVRRDSVGALCRIAMNAPTLIHDEVRVALLGYLGDERFYPGCWVSITSAVPIDLERLLSSPDRRIRLAAAMSSQASNSPAAIDELVSAVGDVEWTEDAFSNGVPTLALRFRFSILRELLSRVDADSAAPDVVAAICDQLSKRATKFTVAQEWGRAIQWAFAERETFPPVSDSELAPLPTEISPTQRAILEELLAIDDLWDPTFGNGRAALRRVQLPYDREALQRLL